MFKICLRCSVRVGVGGALRFAHEAAVDAGMHKRAGKWTLQRCRARAAKRLAAV